MTRPFLASFRDSIRPDDPRAVDIAGDPMSRAELREAALRFAMQIPDEGPLAVCAEPTRQTVVAVVGALLRGVTVVPVPPDAGGAELQHIVEDSGATCWAGPARDGVALRRIGGDHDAPPAPQLPEPPDPETIAMVLYTSGTTGAPKGVALSHRALSSGIDALADAWAWTEADTVAHGLPLFHSHGLVIGVLGSLHVGSRVIHTGRPTSQNYAAANATMYFAVPTIWARIARDEPAARSLSRARLLVSGSAPLPLPVLDRLRELTGQTPVERYGMTETMVTLSTRADGERRPGWVGVPVAGAQTRLRSPEGADVPSDGASIGELHVRGPMLFSGYLNQPKANEAAWTSDGWFVTGDLAVKDPDGVHRIVGRASVDLIKSGGYRIGAGEIEASLLARPEVREAAVVGLPDDDLGQRIVAFVVPEDASSADEQLAARLIVHVADDLSWHKRPREVRFVPQLPRNSMGKVQKTTLAK